MLARFICLCSLPFSSTCLHSFNVFFSFSILSCVSCSLSLSTHSLASASKRQASSNLFSLLACLEFSPSHLLRCSDCSPCRSVDCLGSSLSLSLSCSNCSLCRSVGRLDCWASSRSLGCLDCARGLFGCLDCSRSCSLGCLDCSRSRSLSCLDCSRSRSLGCLDCPPGSFGCLNCSRSRSFSCSDCSLTHSLCCLDCSPLWKAGRKKKEKNEKQFLWRQAPTLVIKFRNNSFFTDARKYLYCLVA